MKNNVYFNNPNKFSTSQSNIYINALLIKYYLNKSKYEKYLQGTYLLLTFGKAV